MPSTDYTASNVEINLLALHSTWQDSRINGEFKLNGNLLYAHPLPYSGYFWGGNIFVVFVVER